MFSDSNSVDGTGESDPPFTRFDVVLFITAMTIIVIVASILGVALLVVYTTGKGVSTTLQWAHGKLQTRPASNVMPFRRRS